MQNKANLADETNLIKENLEKRNKRTMLLSSQYKIKFCQFWIFTILQGYKNLYQLIYNANIF